MLQLIQHAQVYIIFYGFINYKITVQNKLQGSLSSSNRVFIITSWSVTVNLQMRKKYPKYTIPPHQFSLWSEHFTSLRAVNVKPELTSNSPHSATGKRKELHQEVPLLIY